MLVTRYRPGFPWLESALVAINVALVVWYLLF